MKNASTTPAASRLVAALACLLSGGWAAAQVPDAGRVLRESAPAIAPATAQAPAPALLAPTAPSGLPAPSARPQASFVLAGVSFAGNTQFSSATLGALMADRIGQRVTFNDLQALAERVTAHYRDADYVLTRTVVPAQDVSGGRVEFSVLEGRLGKVGIERLDDARVRDAVIDAIVGRLPKDRPLTRRELERAILTLSDTPGMQAQASLETGDQPGTYDLIVELRAAPLLNVSADVDNEGSRATGEYRIGASVRVNGPFGRGDNIDLRLFNAFGKGLTFGRASYETPVGASGWRASAGLSHVRYALGRDFAALDAYGSADVVDLSATYPILRSRGLNLFFKAGYAFKRLRDTIGAIALASTKQAQDLNLGLVYEKRDTLFGGGFMNASLTAYAGDLALRSPAALATDQAPLGLHTNGRFLHAGYTASRLQSLTRDLSAYAALAGQWADTNLDSADKIAIGGARAVRAYSSASGIGDEAQIANLELRWSVTPDASLSAFYDVGRVRINHAPGALPGANHATLAGPGLALYWTVMNGAALRASIAWPKRDAGAVVSPQDEHGARAYAQLVKTF